MKEDCLDTRQPILHPASLQVVNLWT